MLVFIYAPSYDSNSGGSIVLHRLCHIINTTQEASAYIIPFGYPQKTIFKKVRATLKGTLLKPKNYLTNKNWNTPIWDKTTIPKDAVAIYPEIIDNNPLKVNYIVRWLLHQPGFHTNKINYGKNELYFKFNSAIKNFQNDGSKLSKNELKVIYYPIDIYNIENLKIRDIECCHMIRKGSYKNFIHNENSILLDGKDHKEIADIFRRSKRFICYDDYTAYSIFSVLCGCESIVVPDKDIPITSWYPNESDRFGLAYGLDEEQLIWAKETQHLVLEHILDEHKKTEKRVLLCIQEIKDFFSLST